MPQARPRPPASPEALAAAQSLLVQARKLMDAIAEHWLLLGATYNALLKDDLYQTLGVYLSFRHFLRQQKLTPYATAAKYMLLARTYTRTNAYKLGIEKAVELLRVAAWEEKDPDELASTDAVIGDKPVSEHTATSLELLRLANERRKEENAARKAELAADPVLADRHKRTRSTANAIERLLESTFAGPDAESRAVRTEGQRDLRVRLELSLEDAEELLAILRELEEDDK